MSNENDMEHSSSDMNVAPWLSHATLDMSVSFLRCARTLVNSETDHPYFCLGSGEVCSLVYHEN